MNYIFDCYECQSVDNRHPSPRRDVSRRSGVCGRRSPSLLLPLTRGQGWCFETKFSAGLTFLLLGERRLRHLPAQIRPPYRSRSQTNLCEDKQEIGILTYTAQYLYIELSYGRQRGAQEDFLSSQALGMQNCGGLHFIHIGRKKQSFYRRLTFICSATKCSSVGVHAHTGIYRHIRKGAFRG